MTKSSSAKTPKKTRSAGGIFLPDNAQKKPTRGVIVAAGPGRRLDDGTLAPMGVAVGDKVLYGKWSGTETTIKGSTT